MESQVLVFPVDVEVLGAECAQAIDALELTMVKHKLCLPEDQEGKGWTLEMADTAEIWYKRFLKLNAMYPKKSIVPTKTIDAVWHAHILDTRAYIPDCQRVFGEYFHHFPYFGLRGEDDARDLADSFAETCELFVRHFGESPITLEASGCNNRGGNGGSGGGSKCSRK